MAKKFLVTAAIFAAIVSGNAAQAAGPAGLARSLSSVIAPQIAMAELPAVERSEPAGEATLPLTFTKRRELLRINSAVNETIAEVDGLFDGFAGDFALDAGKSGCFDCADLKRNHLLSLGWAEDTMRIAYSVSNEGRVERVLVISTDRGDVVLGNDSPVIDMSGNNIPAAVEKSAVITVPLFTDI